MGAAPSVSGSVAELVCGSGAADGRFAGAVACGAASPCTGTGASGTCSRFGWLGPWPAVPQVVQPPWPP